MEADVEMEVRGEGAAFLAGVVFEAAAADEADMLWGFFDVGTRWESWLADARDNDMC
jgi:hypothetical protein